VRDRQILLVTAFLRALATGLIGVVLGLYLAALALDCPAIGTVVGAGLGGGAVATAITTVAGDRLGRRRMLTVLALAAAAGGVWLAFAATPNVLALAAFAGMVNGMGRDRGAALVLEQSVLPATTTAADRTRVFAWYNVLQDAGHALGSLLAGSPALIERLAGAGELPALRLLIGAYALLLFATALLYQGLSPAIEETPAPVPRRVSPATRRVLWRISGLFALDSLGGGFLTTALITYFFAERFGVGAEVIGPLFFAARILNAVSHLAAAWLARRIGLVNTMVFTHMPSSLLLVTVAFAPRFWIAALLFLVREGLVEMDVPTRQSYVMAVVRPEERTVASGVTHLVRTAGWALGPLLAGPIMHGVSLGAPLAAGAAMKLAYDVLLYFAFRDLRPPEECDRSSST
jgi:MFS family permease